MKEKLFRFKFFQIYYIARWSYRYDNWNQLTLFEVDVENIIHN